MTKSPEGIAAYRRVGACRSQPVGRGKPASRSGRSERVGPEIGLPAEHCWQRRRSRVRILPATGVTLEPGARATGRGALGPAGVVVDGALGKDSSESLEGLAGRLGAPRTAKARDISGTAVKLPCACETGGWGRISDTTRPGTERGPLGQRGSSLSHRGTSRTTAGTQSPELRQHPALARRMDANRADVGVCRERLEPTAAREGSI